MAASPSYMSFRFDDFMRLKLSLIEFVRGGTKVVVKREIRFSGGISNIR